MNSNKEKSTFYQECMKYLAFTEVEKMFPEEDMIELIIEQEIVN